MALKSTNEKLTQRVKSQEKEAKKNSQIEAGLREVLEQSRHKSSKEISALLENYRTMLTHQRFIDVARTLYDLCGTLIGSTAGYVALLDETVSGLVRICYQRGPFLRAISEAATTDKRFEKDWRQFLAGFDELGFALITRDQQQGLTPRFDPRPVIVALNRLNAHTLIEAFGRRPRNKPEPVRKALSRIWISTLYGAEWVDKASSTLVRK